MNFDLTRQSLFTTIFYFILLTAVFWGGWVVGGLPEAADNTPLNYGTPAGVLIDSWFARFPLAGIVLSTLLVFVNSMLVTRLTIRSVFFMEKSYMPALVYLLISSGYYNSYMSFRPLLASLAILIGSGLILRSYDAKHLMSGGWVTIGFCFGIAALIYAPAVGFVLMVFIALMLFRMFDIREWLSAITGIALPIVLVLYIVWFMGNDAGTVVTNYRDALLTYNGTMPGISDVTPVEWLFLGTVALTAVLGVFSFARHQTSGSRKPVKAFVYFLWMTLLAFAILFAPCRSIFQLPLAAMGLAVIIPAYFNGRKPSLVSNLLYALLIISAVAIHIVPLINDHLL